MRASLAAACTVLVAGATTGWLAGCSFGGGDSSSESTIAKVAPAQTVAIPPERQSPFCEGIHLLNDQLDAAAPDADTTGLILDAYSALVDVVPAEIRADFLTVMAALQAGPVGGSAATTSPTLASPPETSIAGTAPPTTGEDFEEGYTPDADAAQRLNAYIQFACRDSQNNPGPADTQPEPPPVTTITP